MSKATPLQVGQVDLHPDYLNTQRSNPQDITFTPHQLKAIETLFPEPAEGCDSLSEAFLRHRLGQRSVVAFIRGKTRSA